MANMYTKQVYLCIFTGKATVWGVYPLPLRLRYSCGLMPTVWRKRRMK